MKAKGGDRWRVYGNNGFKPWDFKNAKLKSALPKTAVRATAAGPKTPRLKKNPAVKKKDAKNSAENSNKTFFTTSPLRGPQSTRSKKYDESLFTHLVNCPHINFWKRGRPWARAVKRSC
jgi:hypothetical protein